MVLQVVVILISFLCHLETKFTDCLHTPVSILILVQNICGLITIILFSGIISIGILCFSVFALPVICASN